MPSNRGKAVTIDVVSIRPRFSAASPRATVVPTPPHAPIIHSPTRRSRMAGAFGKEWRWSEVKRYGPNAKANGAPEWPVRAVFLSLFQARAWNRAASRGPAGRDCPWTIHIHGWRKFTRPFSHL